jgi:PAS domain S-box-containing protein
MTQSSRHPSDISPAAEDNKLHRESEAATKALLQTTGTATFIKEHDLIISKVNAEFEKLTGYSKSEIEGKMSWTAFIHPDDRERLVHLHAQRRRPEGAPSEVECRIIDKEGKSTSVFLALEIIPGSQRSIGAMTDLTRLKALEREQYEQKTLLTAILDNYEGFIYLVSQDYRLEYMNEEAMNRFGIHVRGEICYQALYNRQRPCPFCAFEKVMAGETVRFENKHPSEQRWFYSVNSPIARQDGALWMLAMVADIHERKTVEVALRENATLLTRENLRLRSSMRQRSTFGNIIGRSPAMQGVYEQIFSAAASDANIIIYGEPGTGKELVAHAIHDNSERRKGRIVPVHCGAIPDNLVESEFFGYVKGAFSGANADKKGYVEYADGGTLFLDEVGEINLHMQVKLLRVIEGGGYTPVGGHRLQKSNFRIIAATNRDLQDLVEQRRMREDFFYRVHILPIYLPPLRERKEDVPLLVEHFLRVYCGKKNMALLSGKQMAQLMAHDWPGNVRELQNVIIRYCARQTIDLTPATIQREDDAPPVNDGKPPTPRPGTLTEMVDAVEKDLILQALEANRWHRGNTAAKLGVDRKTLFNKLKRHKIATK